MNILLLFLLIILLLNKNESHLVSLLVPVTSKTLPNDIEIEKSYLFTNLVNSLITTITIEDYDNYQISLYLGVDNGDLLYDNKNSLNELKRLFKLYLPNILFKLIRLDYHNGRLAYVWNELVHKAYKNNNEYFIFLSDDAKIQSNRFINNIINNLKDNNNFGIVSFFEIHKYAIPGSWPTFPCFHRNHVDIFGIKSSFDKIFMNSYVDIWISDIYKIYNAVFINKNAKILNIIGGEDKPRYNPSFPGWEEYIDAVHRGRRKIAIYLGSQLINKNNLIPSIKSWYHIVNNNNMIDNEIINDNNIINDDNNNFIENNNIFYQFQWTPLNITYGSEGFHYIDYCKQAPGCIL